jgi:Barstar (barnase inhibitor)
MDPRRLLEVDEHAPLWLFRGDQKTASEAAWGWREAGLTVRIVRGRKMRTVNSLFDEVSAALQFPPYFGENWAAFDECLADMDWWLPTGGLVVAISNSADVLTDESDAELAAFVRAIAHARETYALPIESGEWWDRPALPFHVVLQVRAEAEASMCDRWQASGGSLRELG